MTDIHDTADLVSKALRRAWHLGQDYRQYSSSGNSSDWRKADVTQVTFYQLVEDTRAILESNSDAQPTPDGWKLVPIEPTQEMLNHVIDERLDALVAGKEHTFIDIYKAMLATAPETKL